MPIPILMPALSPTMSEGNLTKWLVKEGDKVKPGQVMAEIETDKATMEVEAVDGGTIGKILIPAGTPAVKVNAPIAVLLKAGEDASALASFAAPSAGATVVAMPIAAPAPTLAAAPAAMPEVAMAVAATAGALPSLSPSSGRLIISPLAKRLAAQLNIDPTRLRGTGPAGRIVKADIEAAQKTGTATVTTAPASVVKAAPIAPTLNAPRSQEAATYGLPDFEIVPHSSVRKTVAQRLTQSKQSVPHFYLTVDFILDALLDARKQVNSSRADNEKISVNDFVIKAMAKALRAVPNANVAWTDMGMRRYKNVDISVAVAIEGGLITPVIRDADALPLSTIAALMKDFAARARAGKLKPDEYAGGTISLSNLGMYGVKQFGAIINPPQAAILAVGAGEARPVVRAGAVVPATVMSGTLSLDHRAIDGAVGAEYLAALKGFIENPLSMLV